MTELKGLSTMNYIVVTVTARIPVPHDDLCIYEATNIDEAAKNQERWYKNNEISLLELLDGAEVTKVIFGTATE